MRLSAGGVGLLGLAGFALMCGASVGHAFAADGARYCATGVGRHIAVRVPKRLEQSVAAAFGISVDVARQGAFVRCANGKLMACFVGANLDCGKANTHRSLLGATAYCRDHPDADPIPMFATGHDTIYDWRCDGRHAVAGKTNRAVDALGYIAGNWKELP
jgi:hypothetical protein